MTSEKLLSIAKRNLKKAEIAHKHNYDRQGITENERENLSDNVEHAKIVLDLINAKINKGNTYNKAKENARNKAIEWQRDFDNHNYSYEELAYYRDYFERLAKRYGLIKEFKENGII